MRNTVLDDMFKINYTCQNIQIIYFYVLYEKCSTVMPLLLKARQKTTLIFTAPL